MGKFGLKTFGEPDKSGGIKDVFGVNPSMEFQYNRSANLTTYILAGQSNALGAEPMANLQAEYVGSNDQIQMWDDTAYTDIDSVTNTNQFPVSSRAAEFGVEFSFGKKLSDNLGEPVYIQKYAVGGTTLAIVAGDDWNTANVGELYDDLKTEITDADDTANTKAMIWIQGTSDADGVSRAAAYEANLTSFINGIRTHVGNADLKVIIVLLNDNLAGAHSYSSQVRTAQCLVREAMSNVVTINPNSLSMQVDNVHYDATGYDDLGELIYNEEIGTSQTQTFTNLLSFESASSQQLQTAKANIDSSILTGVRPTYSVICTYKIDHNAGTTNSICGLFNDSTDRALVVYGSITGDKPRLTTYGTGGVDNITANASSVPKGKWVCVVFSIDGTASKIFVNGVNETDVNQIDNTATYGAGALGTNWILGQYDSTTPGAANYADMKIANFAIVDYALSAAEALSLTGSTVNDQIQPVKIGTVVAEGNIVSLVEDNYSWNGSAVTGTDSWTSVNMTADNITVDSPS